MVTEVQFGFTRLIYGQQKKALRLLLEIKDLIGKVLPKLYTLYQAADYRYVVLKMSRQLEYFSYMPNRSNVLNILVVKRFW